MLLGVGMLLLVLGAKLGLIHFYGTDQPFADQWAAEGVGFLQAPLHGGLNWASFFWPHGEHRPAVTRFITRGLVVANDGQWDCYVEIVFNLSIYAAFLVVAWRLVLKVATGTWLAAVAMFMAILFAAPCAYENLLWGFQSQFVFLLFCGLLHVYGTTRSMKIDGVWWIGQLAGFCGLFSIAAGVMSAGLLVVLAVIEIVRGRRDRWAGWTLGLNTMLLIYGLWLLPEGVTSAGHRWEHLFPAFERTAYLLSWPLGGGWWWILIQAPCIGSLVLWFLRPMKESDDRLVALIGCWIFLVAFAVAYGRILTPETIGVRYYDVLLTGVFANGLSLVTLLRHPRGRLGPWLKTAAFVWIIVIGLGYLKFNTPSFSGAMLRQQKIYAVEQTQIVRKFMASDDVNLMQEFENRTHRFPHFQLTLALLRDKQVQSLLPPSLSSDTRIGPLSQIAPLISQSWIWWMGSGLLLFLLAVVAGRRQCRDWD